MDPHESNDEVPSVLDFQLGSHVNLYMPSCNSIKCSAAIADIETNQWLSQQLEWIWSLDNTTVQKS